MTMFNCKITEWHYFLIFYYNAKIKECNLNKALLNKCKGKVEILFYEPINKIFYETDKITQIKDLKLNYNSNLDNYSSSYSSNIIDTNDILESKDIPQPYKIDEVKNSFLKDLSFLGKKDLNIILKEISHLMKIQGSLELKYKTKFVTNVFLPPKKGLVFLLKKKSSGFLSIISIFEGEVYINSKFYDLKDNKEIISNEFYDLIDKKSEFFYILKIKRNYNAFKEEYDDNDPKRQDYKKLKK